MIGEFKIQFIHILGFDLEFQIKRLFRINYLKVCSKLSDSNIIFFIFQESLINSINLFLHLLAYINKADHLRKAVQYGLPTDIF